MHPAAAILAAHRQAAALDVSLGEVGPGSAVLSLTVGPDMVNGLGVCHGGVLFALADLATTVAAGGGGRSVLVVGSTIELLSPAHLGTVVEARAVEVHARGRTAVYDTALAGPDGAVLALVRCRVRLVEGSAAPAVPAHPAT